MINVNPLLGAFGAEIYGISCCGGIDNDTMSTLTNALYNNRVIVIRNQHFDKDIFLKFGRRWGTPIPHVLDHIRMPGYPELMVVGNTEEKDKKNEIRNGAALWHTDQSYEQIPASATMLYSIIAPRIGGETQFCDMGNGLR